MSIFSHRPGLRCPCKIHAELSTENTQMDTHVSNAISMNRMDVLSSIFKWMDFSVEILPWMKIISFFTIKTYWRGFFLILLRRSEISLHNWFMLKVTLEESRLLLVYGFARCGHFSWARKSLRATQCGPVARGVTWPAYPHVVGPGGRAHSGAHSGAHSRINGYH